MSMADIWKSLKTPEHRLAWVVAIAADALQIAVAPLFAEGGISPADVVLDVVVGALLIRLLGLTPTAAPVFPLQDVSSSDALFGDIQLVVSSDLISLEDSGSFDVDGKVSGEEAVHAIERLLRLSHGKTG